MKIWTLPLSLAAFVFTISCHAQEPSFTTTEKFIAKVEPKLNSILYNTEKTASQSTLLSNLKAVGLDCLLDYDGQFTVFAPSNAAFEKLSEITSQWLTNPENNEKLKAIMSYHIVAGNLSASKMLKAMCRGNGEASFTTILGEKITATMNGIDIVLTDTKGNQAKIVAADSELRNGVVHEIDSVFLPIGPF